MRADTICVGVFSLFFFFLLVMPKISTGFDPTEDIPGSHVTHFTQGLLLKRSPYLGQCSTLAILRFLIMFFKKLFIFY